MPFTFSHPGFGIPLKKWKPAWFSSTGIFFGSIAPDMDIIMRLTNQRFHIFQYDLYCVVVYIFPIAFLFSIYYHLVIRNVLIDHLPAILADRYARYKSFDYLRHLRHKSHLVIFSIFLSIYLHVFMDMISHFNATNFQCYGGVMYLSEFMADVFFYGAIYLPSILLTFIGFYLIIHLTQTRLSELAKATLGLIREPQKMIFYFILVAIALSVTLIKTVVGGLDQSFPVDILIINLTNGCMLSAVITPTLFFIRNKIKKVT